MSNISVANGGYVQGFGPGTQLNFGFNNSRQTLNARN